MIDHGWGPELVLRLRPGRGRFGNRGSVGLRRRGRRAGGDVLADEQRRTVQCLVGFVQGAAGEGLEDVRHVGGDVQDDGPQLFDRGRRALRAGLVEHRVDLLPLLPAHLLSHRLCFPAPSGPPGTAYVYDSTQMCFNTQMCFAVYLWACPLPRPPPAAALATPPRRASGSPPPLAPCSPSAVSRPRPFMRSRARPRSRRT